ncbi:hypothetical protein RINTHH_3690 [Richelia intracellularis HH01]|uniref:Uncharacterized protein n=1 Tax=Richelia intracellularis HH01 TaxID=1165094 RepID=M1WQQ9_9NOST|nr:hypothetical protein RINTHH_3690 [Richelia intracellularis HH01]
MIVSHRKQHKNTWPCILPKKLITLNTLSGVPYLQWVNLGISNQGE